MNSVGHTTLLPTQWDALQTIFGERLQKNIPLARYTAARIGGFADAFLVADSVSALAETVTKLWHLEIPFFILGGGSNILVSDLGLREVVILNRAKAITLDAGSESPSVFAESGASFGQLARKTASKGLSGLEWAAGVPGTVGGAVFGNAGAHGSDVAAGLISADILHQDGQREDWPVEKLAYEYRSSILKKKNSSSVILAAKFKLTHSDPEKTKKQLEEYSDYRKRTQPPGASMGSMFKNPPGDYAGRLIEAAGLKGARMGSAEISPVHANFFVSNGTTQAADILKLIDLAKNTVLERFDIHLELEIELVGEWNT